MSRVIDLTKDGDGNGSQVPVAPSRIEIAGQDMQMVEYHGRRVVTFAMIDRLHQRPSGTAKKRFNENKSRLAAGEDFYLVDYAQRSVLRTFEIEVPPRGLTLLTLSGYLLLVKAFSDDLAWNVQRRLVSSYFLPKAMVGSSQGKVLSDLKAVPLLCHEKDRIGQAVTVIAAASIKFASSPEKSWHTLAERLQLPAPSPAKSREEMELRIWRSLCDLGGADMPDRIPRGALPRIWALLNHMNRFYSGGRERIGGTRQAIDPRNVLVGPPKPVAALHGMTLRRAFSKQTAIHLESQLGDIPVTELLGFDRSFLGRVPNIGGKKVAEIESFFAGYGLRLGMSPDKSASS